MHLIIVLPQLSRIPPLHDGIIRLCRLCKIAGRFLLLPTNSTGLASSPLRKTGTVKLNFKLRQSGRRATHRMKMNIADRQGYGLCSDEVDDKDLILDRAWECD
eukprot:GHVS01099195.1.p1 GENE.GHVS01099195.1~~GHVS01099195.1.p1  ORF type:complete len:103 (-),score=7.24 GHVS01099195.1:134-442(-)